MTDSEIIGMLTDLVEVLDYDLAKELFLGEEAPKDVGEVQELIGIVKHHMQD